MFSFYQERERESDLRQGDSVEIAIIRITLLSFLLHFLFDLLRSPKGSWVGNEDSPAQARPANVVLQQPDCNVPINLELNVAETERRCCPINLSQAFKCSMCSY